MSYEKDVRKFIENKDFQAAHLIAELAGNENYVTKVLIEKEQARRDMDSY
ncbi:MAG: hypothetical protein WC472_04560 [Candidatus Paceibacterota bacterium]